MSRFTELLDRFFYRPDEEVGPFLELAPEVEASLRALAEEQPEEFLAFELGEETYAIPIGAVREIFKVSTVTEVPRAQPNVIGLINVRGEMLPLYDVKVRLRLADAVPVVHGAGDLSRNHRVVLLHDAQEGDCGILVDRVLGVVKLALSKLEARPNLGLERDAIAGLARKDGRMYILLDVEEALA